jgi:hypothetical protein
MCNNSEHLLRYVSAASSQQQPANPTRPELAPSTECQGSACQFQSSKKAERFEHSELNLFRPRSFKPYAKHFQAFLTTAQNSHKYF